MQLTLLTAAQYCFCDMLCRHDCLEKAFRALDEEGAGYIETSRMNELLISKGTPFRAKEIEAFMTVAKVTIFQPYTHKMRQRHHIMSYVIALHFPRRVRSSHEKCSF